MKTPFHYHSTIQVVIDLEDAFTIETRSGVIEKGKCAVIMQGVIHRFNSKGSTQLILYIEKASAPGKQLMEIHFKQGEIVFPEFEIPQLHLSKILDHAIIRQDNAAFFNQVQIILNQLTGVHESQKPVSDTRIIKVREIIDSSHPADLTMEKLADEIHLSVSRLRHLFKEQMAIGLKQYILWRRIIYSIHLLLTGKIIGEAAFESGFSDLSHYHKMMVKMFGISPSHIIRQSKKTGVNTSGKDIFEIRTEIPDTGKSIEYKF